MFGMDCMQLRARGRLSELASKLEWIVPGGWKEEHCSYPGRKLCFNKGEELSPLFEFPGFNYGC